MGETPALRELTQMKDCDLCQMPRPAAETPCLLCGSAAFAPPTSLLPADFSLRLIAENRFPAAFAYLESLIARGEESPEICLRLAWLAYAFTDYRAVETWSHESLRLDDTRLDPHLLLGLVLQRSGRWAEAADEFAAGLRKPDASPRRRAFLESFLAAAIGKIPEF